MNDFAPSFAQMNDSGINVTPTPTAGAGLALDVTGKVPMSALPFNAIIFGSNVFSFSATADSSNVVLTNLTGLRQPNGAYLTPKAAFVSCVQSTRPDVFGTSSSFGPGTVTFRGRVAAGVAITDTVTFYYLVLA